MNLISRWLNKRLSRLFSYPRELKRESISSLCLKGLSKSWRRKKKKNNKKLKLLLLKRLKDSSERKLSNNN
jgi:hypothetical protein